MSEGEKELQAMLETLQKRIDDHSEMTRQIATQQKESQTEFFELKSSVQLMTSEVRRLCKKIEEGNGITARLLKVETLLVNQSEGISECQKRSAARWKILIGAIVTIVVGAVGYLVVKVIEG